MPLACQGGQQRKDRITFPPAPPVIREYLRIMAFLMSDEKEFITRMTDASQAFAQSDLYNVEDRALVLVPGYVSMRNHEWEGELLNNKERTCMGDENHKIAMAQEKYTTTRGIWL